MIFKYDINKNYLGYAHTSLYGGTDSNCHYITFRSMGTDTNIQVQVENGSTISNYVPYREPQNIPIPASIQALDGYGWSAGSVYNEVDFENKQFIQRVGRVVLDGTQQLFRTNWLPTENGVGWLYPYSLTQNVIKSQQTITNIVSSKFQAISYADMYGNKKEGIALYYENALGICIWQNNTDLNTVYKVNAYLQANPITVYYELAEPIITDISDLLDNTFNAIECEGNGSITFKSDTDYKVPIPNAEEYLIYLNEVN